MRSVALAFVLGGSSVVGCRSSTTPPPVAERPPQAASTESAPPAVDARLSADASPLAVDAGAAREPLPTCGSADWEAMGRARVKACAAKRTEFETTACRVVTSAWRCPADIREAFDGRWGPNAVVVQRMAPKRGEFYGIVFAKRDGAWQVIGFDGGDVY